MPNIDSLDIQIMAQAQNANKALDGLVARLGSLSASLGAINGTGLVGFSNGVRHLASAMQTMSNVKTTDVTRLAKNIERLGAINSAGLQNASQALTSLTNSFNSMGAVSQNALQVGELASNLSKLGYKSITTATQNLPALASGLRNLMATLAGAPRVSKNVIDMTNALSNLARSGRSVGTAANSLSTNLKRFNTSTQSATVGARSLASAIGRLYANFWLLYRIGRLFGRAITNTADYIEAYNYFNVAFDKIGSEWGHQFEKYGYDNAEAYADSFADRMNETLGKMSGVQISVNADGTGLLTTTGVKSLGLNIEELTQAASNIAAITNSVGQTGEVSLAAAQSLSALAGDMSSLFNIDYADVMGNLQSGLIGQSRALYKYGIDITNATLQTYAYEMGLSKAVSEMTQAEKMQLRLIAILDQSKVAWGDLANTINTPSNMIRQFKTNISELGTTIGQLFIPVLSKVLPFINGLTIALSRLMVTIAGFFGISLDLDGFSQGFSGLDEEIGGVSDSLDNVAGSAKKAKAGLRGFDELKTISMPSSGGGGGGAGGGGGLDLTDEILAASDEYMKAWNDAYAQMENKAQGFADRISRSLEPVKKLFKDISIGDWFAVGEDVSTITSNIFNFFAKAIENVNWQKLGDNMGKFFAGIDWTRILSSVGRAIWAAINAAFDLWSSSFSAAPLETALFTLLALPGIATFGTRLVKLVVAPFTRAISFISASITNLSGVFSAAAGAISAPVILIVGAFAALAAGLGHVFATNENVRESFYAAADSIKDGLQPVTEFFSNKVLPDLRNGWNKLSNVLSPLATFVKGVFTDAWQKFLNPALKYFGDTMIPKLSETFSNLWNNVLVPMGGFVADVFTPIFEVLSWVLTQLWKNIIVPLGETVGTMLSGAFEKHSNLLNNVVIPAVNAVINALSFLWNDVAVPLASFVGDRLGPIFEAVFAKIKGEIEDAKAVFSSLNTFISSVFAGEWRAAWAVASSAFSEIWANLVNLAKTPLNNLLSLFEKAANRIIDAFNWVKRGINRMVFTVPSWIPVYGGKSFNPNLPITDHISVPRFALGGFVEDGLFQMNDNEIIGQFSTNGKTAVANNDMIVSAIEQAAYEGFRRAMSERGAGSGEVVFRVEGDPHGMFTIVKEEWNDEVRRTGENPVPVLA